MGAGKTSVGQLLAAAWQTRFRDADDLVEAASGRPIRTIFIEEGEAGFRARERSVLERLLRDPDGVVALGGGAVEHHGLGALLRPWFVVYLSVPYEVALERVGGDVGRPMLGRPDLRSVFERRQPRYQALADLEVDATAAPSVVAAAVLRAVGATASGRDARGNPTGG